MVARVLLVDDDQDILELLEYSLTREGYEVLGTSNSTTALEFVETFKPHLVILDIMMPGLSGFEVCSKIRTQHIDSDPIVFFMTQGEDSLQKLAFQSGGDDFIQKFAGLRTLISRVNLVLKRKFKIRKRQSTVRLGEMLVDRDNCAVIRRNKIVSLNQPEFELLFFLVQNAKRSIPIEHLNAAMTGSTMFSLYPPIRQSLEILIRKIGDGLITYTSPHRVRFDNVPE